MEKEFVKYEQALALKELGFDEPCWAWWHIEDCDTRFCYSDQRSPIINSKETEVVGLPLYQQAINFLYICSNKQIDIELKGSDTYEERVRKINQGCEDLRNLQNNKSNQ